MRQLAKHLLSQFPEVAARQMSEMSDLEMETNRQYLEKNFYQALWLLERADEIKSLLEAIAAPGKKEDEILGRAVENLIGCIQAYESDTFSASEAQVSTGTAKRMAAHLIEAHLFDSEGFPGEGVDGAEIGLAYDNVVESIVGEGESALVGRQDRHLARSEWE